MIIEQRKSANGKKIYYRFKWGQGGMEKMSSGIYTYAKPQTQTEKNHNKEALALLDIKQSQLVLEQQSIGTNYIPAHKYKHNFLDFYQEFVVNNKRFRRRHLECSLMHFKKFIGKKSIAPIEITEDLCKRFRSYLLDRLNGETPMNYFMEFKRVIKAATKQGYYRTSPVEEVKSRMGKNPRLKSVLEVEEYLKLLQTPCTNEEVREAFIFCCYTGLRWVDVEALAWFDIGPDAIRTRLIQAKTGLPVVITMHPVAKTMIDRRRARVQGEMEKKKIFALPTANGANKILKEWVRLARIDKPVTWSVARLSFSILLQEKLVDTATVALLLGHRTTKYVNDTYKRHRPKDQQEVIAKLPSPEGW